MKAPGTANKTTFLPFHSSVLSLVAAQQRFGGYCMTKIEYTHGYHKRAVIQIKVSILLPKILIEMTHEILQFRSIHNRTELCCGNLVTDFHSRCGHCWDMKLLVIGRWDQIVKMRGKFSHGSRAVIILYKHHDGAMESAMAVSLDYG